MGAERVKRFFAIRRWKSRSAISIFLHTIIREISNQFRITENSFWKKEQKNAGKSPKNSCRWIFPPCYPSGGNLPLPISALLRLWVKRKCCKPYPPPRSSQAPCMARNLRAVRQLISHMRRCRMKHFQFVNRSAVGKL